MAEPSVYMPWSEPVIEKVGPLPLSESARKPLPTPVSVAELFCKWVAPKKRPLVSEGAVLKYTPTSSKIHAENTVRMMSRLHIQSAGM